MQRGPQPPEGVLSVLLQEFPGYTLEGLLAADYRALISILDYRRAQVAIDLFNGGRHGIEQLQKRPDLCEILLEMGRAQAGTNALTLDHMLANKAAESDEDEDT